MADNVPIDRKQVSISVGTLAAAVIVSFGVLQPMVSTVVGSMVADATFKAQIKRDVEINRQDIDHLQVKMDYVYDGVRRLEIRAGTYPEANR